jgi:gentisate 1,2-dioxygenase
VVTLLNDSDFGRSYVAAVGWLFSGVQAMKPGEITPAHKHTASAHRFIMEGDGAYTVVDGHRITLGALDYVLTPSGCWHDHGVSEEGQVSIWQDGLDIPLMNMLETNFYAVYNSPAQDARGPTNDLQLSYGSASVLPERLAKWDKPYSPTMVYRWAEVEKALVNLASVQDCDPFDGHMIRYANPVTGGWAMKTMGANMQRLPAGFVGRSHRHTGNIVYNVAKGNGYSIIGGDRIDWSEHDIFCVPSWIWHKHVNLDADEPGYLFSFNDFPVMDSLGIRMEENRETVDSFQEVNAPKADVKR